MGTPRRCVGAVATAVVACGLTLGASGIAHADTVSGQSCGEKHGVSPEYYDGFGNAAPCTANFTTSRPGTARITIDVTEHPGNTRNDPHNWSFDVARCAGTVRPSDPPRTFACRFEAGAHTVYVDKSIGDRSVDLRVPF